MDFKAYGMLTLASAVTMVVMVYFEPQTVLPAAWCIVITAALAQVLKRCENEASLPV